MKEFFPIGTVVTLYNGTKPLMIYGRLQQQGGTEDIWDYLACLYPEGNINDSYNVFFNHEDVEKILYTGYQTEEDKNYQKLLIEKCQELEQNSDKNHQVVRTSMPDSIQGNKWYLYKSCSTLLLTYQIKLLTYHAATENAKLIIKVKKDCKFSEDLQDYITKNNNIISVERK